MKKTGVKNKKKFFSKKVKKTLPYQLLMICLIVLVILILIWVVLFIFGKVSYFPKDKLLEGELGTLKWDFTQDKTELEILNYSLAIDNQTIDVNINWTSGMGEDLRGIFIDFVGIENSCNYTENTDLPVFGINKTYIIDYAQTDCNESSFENITSISDILVYAQINIPLTQTSLIENITLYSEKEDSLINILDLDDYFNCLEEIDFSHTEDPNNNYIMLQINETTNLISLIIGVGWYGVQKFNLEASCDGDVLNTSTSGENMSFFIIFIKGERPIINNEPEFLNNRCGHLE